MITKTTEGNDIKLSLPESEPLSIFIAANVHPCTARAVGSLSNHWFIIEDNNSAKTAFSFSSRRPLASRFSSPQGCIGNVSKYPITLSFGYVAGKRRWHSRLAQSNSHFVDFHADRQYGHAKFPEGTGSIPFGYRVGLPVKSLAWRQQRRVAVMTDWPAFPGCACGNNISVGG
jgi:hypothetical protein